MLFRSMAKGMSIYDTYDAKTTPDQSSLMLLDEKGNTIPTSAYKVTWDTTNHKVTVEPTNIANFIKNYGGQVLTLKFNAKVNEDVADGAEIENTAYQNEFGHLYQTDTVTNKVTVLLRVWYGDLISNRISLVKVTEFVLVGRVFNLGPVSNVFVNLGDRKSVV